MTQICVKDNDADIEDQFQNLKVDFSNKYIGGGALIHGSVQE